MVNAVRHLGIIMDGNRRWAKKNKMETILQGHQRGGDTLINVCRWCKWNQIPYLTVYAFSTENWNRTEKEISGLFKLMESFFNERMDEVIREGVNVNVIGDLRRLPEDSKAIIRNAEQASKDCDALRLNIALSYGGRDELLRAVRQCAAEVRSGSLRPEDITESVFESYLDTKGCPDMDMVIRTGGYHRLSNFFPWQTVYSEIYFTDVLWPDFSYEDFCAALRHYEEVTINKGK